MSENKVFDSIMNGLNESLAYAKGDTSKARKMSVTVAELPQYHDKEIKQIVDCQYAQAKTLLSENRDMLEHIAKALLEKETLDEKEFDDLMNEVREKRGE